MVKFKQARRAVKCRTRLQTQRKRKVARSGFQVSKPQSYLVVTPGSPPRQSRVFSSAKLAASSVKDTMLSIRNFSFPNLRNTALFQSCTFTFLSVRKVVKDTVNFTVHPVKNASLSAKTFAFTSMRNTMKSLMMAMLSVFWWCWRHLRLDFYVVKDILFPSRIYLRELTVVKQQVQKLQTELSRLQEAIKNGGTLSSLESSSWQRCPNLSVLDARLPAIPCNLLQPEVPSSVTLTVLPPSLPPPLLPPPPLPPPPPPPPPPPLPPPTFFVPKPVVIMKKIGNSKVLKDAPLKKDGPVHVTLKDLLNVKLKATENAEKQKRSPKKLRSPLVRVSDLQSVNLRKNSTLPPNRITNILISPSKGQLDLRKHLKKVNLQRSPGGTPIYDRENKDNGTGLTPIMARALKQKFQMALPKSPPPQHLHADSRCYEELH